jgi:hypothetical protein
MSALLLRLLLLIIAWPIALLALILYPIVWVVAMPFRLVGVSVRAVFDLLTALITLPARISRR